MDGLHTPAPEEGATPSTPGRNPSIRADTQGGFDSVPLDVSLSVSSPECKIRRVIRVSLGICSQHPPPPTPASPRRQHAQPSPHSPPRAAPGPGRLSQAAGRVRAAAALLGLPCATGPVQPRCTRSSGPQRPSAWASAAPGRAAPGAGRLERSPAPLRSPDRPGPAPGSGGVARRAGGRRQAVPHFVSNQSVRGARGTGQQCVNKPGKLLRPPRRSLALRSAVLSPGWLPQPPPPPPVRPLRSALPLPAARPRSPPSSGPLEGRMRSW
ncbi:unnamed protein product [Eretmochelys imbricata]